MNKKDKNQQINRLEKWESPLNYVGSLLNLLIVFPFLSFWVSPQASDIERIYSCAVLIGFEFIMVHSGVFMAVVPARISLFIFFPIYGLFAIAFSMMVNDNFILYTYLLVVFNRLRYAFFNVSKEVQRKLIIKSALAAVSYFAVVIVGVLCSSSIPTLGLSTNFSQKSNYNHTKLHGGVLLDQPHIAMFIGASYYVLLAIIEFTIAYKKPKKLSM